jgi:Rps23 Pro-64 3,4-dihydroxylase Tpa1-like proline 4-hydroxylase
MINPNLVLGASSLKEPYNAQLPFPHLIFDDFLNETIARNAAYELKYLSDNIKNEEWRFDPIDHHENQVSKRSITVLDNMLPISNVISQYVNNPEFLTFLRDITGMEGLVGDWTFQGGGTHITPKGGSLNIHHDFNFLGPIENPEFYRKVNLLIYLNEDWEEEWNGDLELWEKDLSSKTHNITPKFNRAVLFNIDNAPHGHPSPLECPEGESRRSLAYYFYDKVPVSSELKERAYWKEGNELL